MVKTRRFEFVGGGSYKFWHLSLIGSSVSICFGRIGTAGQSQVKGFHDEAEAQKFADKQIKAKLAKGYLELASCDGGETPASAIA